MSSDIKRTLDAFLKGAPIDESRPAREPKNSSRSSMPLSERLELLKTLMRTYVAPCPYEVGDLITPRPTSHYRQIGEPHIVVEKREYAQVERTWDTDSSNFNYGSRTDVRIIVVTKNRSENAALPYWVESWQFEPWDESKLKEDK